MTRSLIPIVLLASLCAGCLDPPPPISGDITGLWHGARWDKSARVLWSSDVKPGGNVIIRFLTCFNGDAISQQRQTGRAALVDGFLRIELDELEFTDLRTGEVITDAGFNHDYEVIEFSPTRMRYRSEAFGERYEVTRVTADFELACPPPTISVQSDPGTDRPADAWIIRRSWREELIEQLQTDGLNDEPSEGTSNGTSDDESDDDSSNKRPADESPTAN